MERAAILLVLLLLVLSRENEAKQNYQSDIVDLHAESDTLQFSSKDTTLLETKLTQPDDICRVPWWISFINIIIQDFYTQRPPNRTQFGVLYMANIDNLNEFNVHFYPSAHGRPIIDNSNPTSPALVADFGNYLASRPASVGTSSLMVHAERQLLDRSTDLWNAYNNRYRRTPNFLLLYTWIMPCQDCTTAIINQLNQPPFRNVEHRVVAYSSEGYRLPYMTREGNAANRERLRNDTLSVYRQQCYDLVEATSAEDLQETMNPHQILDSKETDESKSEKFMSYMEQSPVGEDPDTHTCKLSDTLQGCLLNCLAASDVCCSCKDSYKRAMLIAMINEITWRCAKSDDFPFCSRTWIRINIGDVYTCNNRNHLQNQLASCANTCSGKRLSNPLDPYNPTSFPDVLLRFSSLGSFKRPDLSSFCKDVRTEGYLCSKYNADSYTAGNSLCRYGNKCATHGKAYSWCYTSYSNHWDYCCTSTCGRSGGTNYWWCQSGNTWQYCGDSGRTIDVDGQPCLPSHPCGLHNDDGKGSYYWCLQDNNRNYQYCCQPEDSCSTKGESYNWCYTGWKKETSWQYCKP